METTAVRVRNLRKTYGERAVVDDISFDIAPGETFGLLGPNGAGKSTTVEILEGYRRRSGGEVEVLGKDPGTGGLDWRARLERDAQVVLLRCLQEALSNVTKHAHATHVVVHAEVRADGSARVTVSDDGAGFDPSAAPPGFGIEGMRERVALAGGRFAVSSAPGDGTTLSVTLPGTAGLGSGGAASAPVPTTTPTSAAGTPPSGVRVAAGEGP
nr:ATP-binding cassette domain-containing protein [Actinomycetales bacterium]